MVSAFRRSLSFPISPRPANKPCQPCHVRSISLPSGSHPAISRLHHDIQALASFHDLAGAHPPSHLSAALTTLERLHDSLDDLLRLPQSHDSIHHRPPWAHRLLDDSLRLADAHGTCRAAVLEMKQCAYEAQVALRRRDHDRARLASCGRSLRRAEKALAKLASELTCMAKAQVMVGPASGPGDAEMAGAAREVTVAAMAASGLVFAGLVGVCSAASSAVSASGCVVVGPLRRRLASAKKVGGSPWSEEEEEWRRNATEKLEGLEECVEAVETRIARVFRSTVNTRVTLLNIMTPSL